MRRKKRNMLRLISILVILSLMVTPNVSAGQDTSEPDEWAIPDVISATLENIDFTENDDIITAYGSLKAGNQTLPFSSRIEFYRI